MTHAAAGAGGGAASAALGLTAATPIGAGLLIGGTLLNAQANRRRTGALNAALGARRTETQGFDLQREQLLAGQQQGILGAGQRTDQNLLNFTQGLAGQQGVFQQGQQQGLADIQAGQDFIGGQVPSLLAGGIGGRGSQVQETQDQLRTQTQPLSDALLQLSAGGLGRQQQGISLGDLQRQSQLEGLGIQSQLGGLNRAASVGQAGVSLEDLLSNIRFQEATQQASQVGGRTQAFGGLFQTVAGGLIGN